MDIGVSLQTPDAMDLLQLGSNILLVEPTSQIAQPNAELRRHADKNLSKTAIAAHKHIEYKVYNQIHSICAKFMNKVMCRVQST